MYAPPRYLTGADLAQLVQFIGYEAFRQLADCSERTMRRWLHEGNAPLSIVRLAWYASPWGRDEAEQDVANELRLQASKCDALQLKLDRHLPLLQVPRYLADASNESTFTVPVPTPRVGAPPWHPAHPRHARHTSHEESA